jgi:HPt (histidine-containing phosphotransfer) domain-containing protein
MDFKHLANELGVGEDIFIELVDSWINSTGEDIATLEAVRGASDINKAVDHAHKIKGASFQLGFNEIAEVARSIELRARAGNLDGLAEAIAGLKAKRAEIMEFRKNFPPPA